MGALPSHASASALDSLNATVGGRLHVGVPFARPCYDLVAPGVGGSRNESQCAEVMQSYGQRSIVPLSFGGYLDTAWETCISTGAQCLLDSNNPNDTAAFMPPKICEQGSLPNYYIDVRSAQDVSAAFEFSRSTGTQLVIKNTGHDLLGRSSGPGSLALWVHNLQDMTYTKSFVPTSCTQDGVPAVTFGVGASLRSLYEFADSQNITILGGADDSLAGGGGYLMGGGHSIFSNSLGMAVDQVLEFDIVTPDGKQRVANACSNPDLFFALRGGGGGTFGVVLQVTLKALPKITSPVIRTLFNDVPTVADQTKIVEFFIENAALWASQGWGGYIEPGVGTTFANPLVNMSVAAATMGPLKQLVTNELNGTFILQEETSFLSLYDQFIDPITLPDGASGAISSRVIPASVFQEQEQRSQLLNAIMAGNEKHMITLLFAVAPFFFKSDNMTSINPAWRSSLWHIIFMDYSPFNISVASYKQVYEALDASVDPFRTLAPNAAVYFNEASVLEPDFSQAFWGSNYDRLLQIKNKYDPDRLLDCWKCVGWTGSLSPRYKCYP